MKSVFLFTLTMSALVAASPVQSKAAKWMAGPPGLPSGSKFMVVSGNPAKEGMFTIRARLPANYTVPPHHHLADEKVSVKSGGPLTYGMGDKINQANSGSLEKGYHVTMTANMNHWVTTSAPTEIEVSAMGPFSIVYVDPKDDPRNK
jgi:hypothetical protein